MIDLVQFADEVGSDGPVMITGLGTRGGPVDGERGVHSPAGIEWIQADEMIVCCGAGTPVDELVAALATQGQTVALPAAGTVGGALAVGRSDHRRLGYGPVRDTLLQARYISAAGEVVKAGGPTVKNVSGFDLCRLLVGSRGTLGFLGEVIVRTRPLPQHSQWFTHATTDPFDVFRRLYKPISVLWNGSAVFALLEGHSADVAEQATSCAMTVCAGPPALPTGSRRSVKPLDVSLDVSLDVLSQTGDFVAEVGVGIVHHALPCAGEHVGEREIALTAAIKHQFDPAGRLNPGVHA